MPHSWIRWIFRGITLSLTGFLGYVMMQQVQSSYPLPVITAPVFETTDAEIEGFIYRQSENGHVQWEVEAQKAENHETEQHLLLARVQVRLFNKNGQGPQMSLEAEEGIINTANGDFDLRNQEKLIAIELENGYTILTPHIHWADEEQIISTNKPVTIEGHGLIITGIGLIAELKTERLGVLDDVHVRISSSI